MKLSLRQKRRVMLGLWVAGFVLMLPYSFSEGGGYLPLGVVGLLIVLVGLGFGFAQMRCPQCGKLLGGGVQGRFCRHCGAEIDLDAR